MNFIDYDSNSLISFYIDNGLEFDENIGFFGIIVKSYVLLEKELVIGALSFSIYKIKRALVRTPFLLCSKYIHRV